MTEQESENQILPFVFQENLPKNTAFGYREFTFEKYKIFAVASLFSEHVKGIENHISVGLDFLVTNFGKEEGEILDRMKAAIFHSGDKLADFLSSLKEPVDDVDYSLALVAFSDGIVYVWLDGGLNVRIYRGNESLIVNEEGVPQFFGSATVELGDIFAISFQDTLKQQDKKIEDYVLDKGKPNYAGLFLDYQMDMAQNTVPQEVVTEHLKHLDDIAGQANENLIEDEGFSIDQMEEKVETNVVTPAMLPIETTNELDEDMQAELAAKEFENKSFSGRTNLSKDTKEFQPSGDKKLDLASVQAKASELQETARAKFAELKRSGVFQKIIEYVKLGGGYFWKGLLAITGAILDFIFGFVYRNSPHQFKRYQTSLKRRNLQYLLILILLFTTTYFVFFRGTGTATTTAGTNTTGSQTATKSEEDTRKKITAKLNELRGYYDNAEVEKFKTAFTELKSLVNNAQNSTFSDKSFLTLSLSTAQAQEDVLFKVTPITKVDEAFLVSSSIQNANIVDFSYIGTDVYAIDKVNASILKSSTTTQSLELFASDKELSAMTNIACEDTSCYITDENVGIVILDIQNKTFSKFSALKTAGLGVTEISTYKVGTTVYIYTLVPTQSKVVRYSRSGQGLTAPATWNKSTGFSSDIVDFAIDGAIYEMSASGTLRRFYGGNVDPSTTFAGLTAPTIPLGTDLQISATQDSAAARFYVSDPVNERIVVYEKTLGQTKQFGFKGSFKYRGTDSVKFTGIKQILVSDDEKSLYVLSNNVVFRINTSAI